MKVYKTKIKKIAGSSFSEVRSSAETSYRKIKSRSKRTPYIRSKDQKIKRSKYFRNEKIFLTIFWQHLFDKREKDRLRRLKFYDCALDLIRHSTYDPETRENFKKKDELLHRFAGSVTSGEQFIVQIKENKRTKRKDLISIYPCK